MYRAIEGKGNTNHELIAFYEEVSSDCRCWEAEVPNLAIVTRPGIELKTPSHRCGRLDNIVRVKSFYFAD